MASGDITDDRALGRLEGRMDSLEARVAGVEGTMSRIEGKVDAVRSTLDSQRGGTALAGRVLNLGVSGSGWVAFLWTWLRGTH